MASHGYEEIDHTADVALRVWGEDFQALLRQAAAGFYDLISIVIEQGSQVETEFVLQQAPLETILVDFLGELLYLLDEKGQAFKTFLFDEAGNAISVYAAGYKALSWERHIKAVTFHNLNIESTLHGFEATITFDV